MDDRQRFRALAVDGVVEAALSSLASRRAIPGGGRRRCSSSAPSYEAGMRPWDLVAGSVDDLSIPGAVCDRPVLFSSGSHQRDRRQRRDSTIKKSR